jgi:hypothetical protein
MSSSSRVRIGISTSNFNKAYIAVAWESRKNLEDYERRGFSQFFYLTICGHIENTLSAIIKARVHSIRYMFVWNTVPPLRYNHDGVDCQYDQKAVAESLLKIIAGVERDTESAPLSKLIELHNKVIFQKSLRDIIGPELWNDLDALASLRNLFAHGREIFVEFDAWLVEGKISLNGNPLQKPAKRLYHAGIIGDLNDITGQNCDDFHALFYSDEALLYFYQAVQQIEDSLASSIEFPPEKTRRFFIPLPDLAV